MCHLLYSISMKMGISFWESLYLYFFGQLREVSLFIAYLALPRADYVIILEDVT